MRAWEFIARKPRLKNQNFLAWQMVFASSELQTLLRTVLFLLVEISSSELSNSPRMETC